MIRAKFALIKLSNQLIHLAKSITGSDNQRQAANTVPGTNKSYIAILKSVEGDVRYPVYTKESEDIEDLLQFDLKIRARACGADFDHRSHSSSLFKPVFISETNKYGTFGYLFSEKIDGREVPFESHEFKDIKEFMKSVEN